MPYPHVMHTGTRRIEFDPVFKLIRKRRSELRHRGSVGRSRAPRSAPEERRDLGCEQPRPLLQTRPLVIEVEHEAVAADADVLRETLGDPLRGPAIACRPRSSTAASGSGLT